MEDEISVGKYFLREKLGEGPLSIIWKAEHRSSGEEVVLKQVSLSKLNRNLKDCLDCELNFLSSVNHPNIIRLIDVIQTEGCTFLVLEFCAGGNLALYIQHHGRVHEQVAKRFTQQLGAGLKVMHAHHIIHRDLKPENVLLSTPDTSAVIKIADFGLSRIVHTGDYAETVCGSPLYMAPEVLQFQRYDEKIDMWSVGAILFELLNGFPPFRGRNNVQLIQNIKKCTCLPFSQLILPDLHPDCIDICSRLLCANPELLRNCSKNSLLDHGRQIHASVVKMGFGVDLIINNDLVGMYGKCGATSTAHKVFDEMPERNVVSWTTLMTGYLLKGNAKASLFLFLQMGSSGIKPNDFTFSTNLKACGTLGICGSGMQIHVLCVKTGFESVPVVANSIIDMYSKCGRIMEATRMFDTMPSRNLISWNTILAGYSHERHCYRSLDLFRRMQEEEIPDNFTFVSVLKACGGLGAMCEGRQVHASLVTRGFDISGQTILASALVDLYVKCRSLSEARYVFNQIEQKNVICWTTMIVGYTQEGNLHEAMELFRQIRVTEVQVDGFILSNMIGMFADLALVEQGKQIHSYTIKVPSGLDVSVSNSVVDMYLKCGLTEEAERRFSEISERTVVSWTVMINGYGKHGYGNEAVRLFEQMKLEKIDPDEVTYLAVLSACSHAGLIEESWEYFSRLYEDRRIKPKVEHYSCMVDLLGRSGKLKEAKNLIDNMELEPTVGIWQTLLGACRVHRDLELGREVGEILLRLYGENPVNYVMMSNLFAECGEWRECERVRELLKQKGLKKEAGCSWIEIDKEVHYFYGGDDRHPLTERIHSVLKEMERRMKEETGYLYKARFSLHDVEEESKEESLRMHSEKLAIGLGLVCGGLENGGVMRVFKNLRVCGDCHEFIKVLSKILKKVVFVVRDANRFHKFEKGVCSCGDYW
ncbi:Protein kinase domain [Macleaya cordata]|uniref:Protein kinase domain n=1 Tax=Macleaya cordata TaxID=56857 RepID=A0A200PMC8_MACCD|nr:Protein kinase domain [Macleaya cordata]